MPDEELAPVPDPLASLSRLSSGIQRALSHVELFRMTMDCAQAALRPDRSGILLLDADGTQRFRAWRSLSPGFREEWHAGEQRLIRDSNPLHAGDVRRGDEFAVLRETLLAEGIHALALVPFGPGPIGTLLLAYDSPRQITEEMLRTGLAISSLMALGYELIRVRGHLRREREDRREMTATALERRMAEHRITAEHVVTQVLANAGTLEEAVPRVLESLAESLSCVFAGFWRPVPQGNVIRCTQTWRSAAVPLDRFDAFTRDIAMERGVGLPGRVWQSGAPTWIPDLVAESSFPRVRLAASSGLRSGFAFPIRIGERTIGVMEFYLTRRAPEDQHLIEMLWAISSEIGQFIHRKEVEAELEKSERSFRTMAEAMPEILYTHDENGDLEYVSARYYEYTGIARPENGSSDFGEALHPEDRERVAALWGAARTSGSPFEAEYRLRSKAGAYRWFHARTIPIREQDRPTRWLGVSTEIDEQKQIEERLKEANQAKDDFLAMLAHELRNPLNPIRSSVHIMNQVGVQDPALDRARGIIDRQVRHMARLIDDLLDVSRISRGKILLRRERVNLNELVRATLEDHRAEIEASAQTAMLDLPPEPVWVSGDPTRLAQIVGNILQNANRFTDAGGTILVRARCDPESGQVELMVRDSGIGMEPRMLDRVFETFTQADTSLEHRGGGLGLGLALVKGLVALHGGSVHAHSEGLGKGSEFSIRLPVATEPPPGAAAVASSAPAAGPCRVLVIEDNLDSAESMKLFLQLNGHTVRIAHTGGEGIERVRESQPDVVLCDVGLTGGMSGYDVAQALRSDPDLGGSYLVAVTGYGREEDIRRAREAGFDRHLTKPVDPKALESMLREIAARLPAIRG